MAARRDKRHGNGQDDRRTTFGIVAPPPGDDREVVMSVSARAHPEPVGEPMTSAKPPGADDVFLTPRVLDERAFQQFAEQLRALINDAESATRQLVQAAEQNRADCGEAARSSQQLQERLRLSARMLKAIQTQGESLERSTTSAEQTEQRLQHLNDSIERRLAELDQHAEELASNIERRIEAHAEEATGRLKHAAERVERLLQDVDRRMEELMPRAERLCQLVETAEVNIAALAHRSADNARKAQQAGDAVSEKAQQCHDQLAGIDQRFERLEELNRILSRAEILHQRWSATLEQLEQSAAAQPTGGAHSEVKSTPTSIEHVVAELRRSVGRDMAQLTRVVHDIATRVDRLQSMRAEQSPEHAGDPPEKTALAPRIETSLPSGHHSTT